jgi:hypothetical protein|tara:strand:- start:8906 stop:9277 length:372 start_codon:yes stop_codon:yes gene_type:complete
MKTVLALLSTLLLSTAVYVSLPPPFPKPEIVGSGICVVEFNASFNSQNGVSWLENISDCNPRRVDIVSQPAMQKEYNIVVVPTIVIFQEGEEVKRFQANIMMQLEATEEEVQEVVDELIMSAF